LSRDEKFIYLVDLSGDKKALQRYEGIKVDQKAEAYSTGPAGVWMMAPDGQHVGTLLASELPANLGLGDSDCKTLSLTARTGLYRIRMKIPGIMPPGCN